MGVVYKGFDPHIERVVAIKTIRKDLVDPELAAQYMARFKNEAKAAGRLHHPNIVGVYEYGEDDDRRVHRDGVRRGHRAARVPQPQRDLRLRAARRADGAAAGRARVRARPRRRPPRHQAVEPDRHRRRASSRSPTSASRASTRRTSRTVGMVIGTPSYMSPEQCRGLRVRRAVRSLQRGRRALRAPDRREAVSRDHRDDRVQDLPRGAARRRRRCRSSSCRPTVDRLVATALAKAPGDALPERARSSARRCATWRRCRSKSTTVSARRW